MKGKLGQTKDQGQEGAMRAESKKEKKGESRAGEIIRTVLLWVVLLGGLALFMMMVLRKCY